MIEYFPQTIYYPKDEVERKWRNGELAYVEDRLVDFIRRNGVVLLDIAKDALPEEKYNSDEMPSAEDFLDAIRILILNKGSIHPPREMADMIQEINKEVWYQGEHGENNARKVEEFWEQKYAYKWREARMFETFVVLEHIAPKAIATIVEASKAN